MTKKILALFFQSLMVIFTISCLLLPVTIHAAGGTIIPEPNMYTTQKECNKALDDFEKLINQGEKPSERIAETASRDKLLGCAIKTGRIRSWMLPYFVTYLIEALIAIAGIISVLFIVVGGYYYVIGGITDDKEKGKKTVEYALIGLVLSLSAWIIINVIQMQVTK